MSPTTKLTPMMQQYHAIRNDLPDNTLLLFRLGDFYEMFHQDAEEGARILGITLTQRQNYPMAGIPYHAAETYIAKILASGKKVAICDQLEPPKPGKGIVKRALTRIITPGTTLEGNQLEASKSHFILALMITKGHLHASWLDLSTGTFQVATNPNPEDLLPVLTGLNPREIILPNSAVEEWEKQESLHGWCTAFKRLSDGCPISKIADYHFDVTTGAKVVMDALKVLNLAGFGLREDHPTLGPAGALVYYATESLCSPPRNLYQIKEYRTETALLLDPATLRNLEIFKSVANTREGSLIAAMDATVTAAGSRLLERYLACPIFNLEELQRRQAAVGEFLLEPGLMVSLQELLRTTRDIFRILGRLQNRIRNPRELGGICETLKQLPSIHQDLLRLRESPQSAALAARIEIFEALREQLVSALADELPGNLQDGGCIRQGYDEELDRLRSLTHDNRVWISECEREEQVATGIKNLKIKFNNAFGYFIEVTKSNLHLVPEHYIRKQTMTNAERFYTEALKEKEGEILHAEEKAIAREAQLFHDLVDRVLEEADGLKATAEALAEVDLFIGWATLAREWNYCRPELDESDLLEVEQGRHPVVEQMLRSERLGLAGTHAFVPNDCTLSASGEQIALITGPNMAGKSTYIRQVALIVLMAQVGSWVPAGKCRLGLVDRIFSRVGASDELARGNSTFMVEMNETANILNNATKRSLIILDEIGRGTSTYDGLSIAWAVTEYLHGSAESGPRTLFATHYHELTQLENQLSRLCNYSVSVKEWNDEIIFVRQVVRGAVDRSYGIQVARLAGLPPPVIERAQILLKELETDDTSVRRAAVKTRKDRLSFQTSEDPREIQMSLF